MQSYMFKDVKAAAAKDKKKGKKDAPEKKPATSGAQAKVASAQRPDDGATGAKRGPQKKNRKDRRKDQRKERRREIKKRVKDEKAKIQQEVAQQN